MNYLNGHKVKTKTMSSEVKDDRDYAIRKGKVLERFNEQFHWRYKHNSLYRNVQEMLIRDADPYELIEKLIEINDAAYQKLNEVMPFVSPNYHLIKPNQQ